LRNRQRTGSHAYALLQGLHVGIGHAPGQRFNRFARTIQQQTLHIKLTVLPALGAPHTGQHDDQELLQPPYAGHQSAGFHTSRV
jgi:hypothetical protein